MNLHRITITILSFILCSHLSAEAQDMEKEVSKLADKLAVLIKEQGKKKVAVIDFTDLQGGGSELGKYIAEELTVDLVMVKRDFSVLDRANLRRVLAEHKLTATGLIDPENAKKLGQFAGVDAIIIGTIIPKGMKISLTAKIIAVDTAEIAGATKAEFQSDAEVQKLISQPAVVGTLSEKAEVVKSFGDMGVELNSLTVANEREYVLDLVLKNQTGKKSIWVALGINANGSGRSKAFLRSPQRAEFETWSHLVSGIETCPLDYKGTIFRATEIKPGDSIPVSIKFTMAGAAPAQAGQCTVQLEFLLGYSFNRGFDTKATPHNLVAKMEAK